MTRPVQAILIGALLMTWGNRGLAQEPGLPPAPVPVAEGPPPTMAPPPPGSVRAGPTLTPAPPPIFQPTYVCDDPGPVAAPAPRLFADVEAALVFPQLSHWAPSDSGGFRLPKANLDVTVAPRFTLGYLFNDDSAVLVSYRFLVSDGHDDGDPSVFGANLHSRVEDHAVDLDYRTPEYPSLGEWKLQANVGARLASVFMDNEVSDDFSDTHWSNRFIGAGPHGGLGLWRPFGATGLALFGKADGGLLIGDGRQKLSFDDGSGSNEIWSNGPELVPTLNAEAGLSWTCCRAGYWLRLTGGYQFEEWWFVPSGKHHDQALFHDINLLDHGPFLRCELRF